MTVGDLISLLEGFDESMEVRMMTQESWPFENKVHGVAFSGDFVDEDEMEEEVEDFDQEQIVYLVEGDQIRYGNRQAWEVADR